MKNNSTKTSDKEIAKNKRFDRVKKLQSSGVAWLVALLLLVACIPVNLIADKLNINWDMTATKLYTLSDITDKFLKSLDQQVDIYFLYNETELSIDDDLQPLYNAIQCYDSYDKVNVIYADPATADGAKTIESLNLDDSVSISTGDFVIKCKDVVKTVTGSSMFASESSEDSDGNTTVSIKYFQGENYLTSSIKFVTTYTDKSQIPVIYFLTGHGESSIEDNYSSIVGKLESELYYCKELDLTASGASIPDDAKMIIDVNPEKDITDSETQLLDGYFDDGGSVCFMMSPNEEKFNYTNIETIMSDYGLAMNYDRAYYTDEYSDYMLDDDPYTMQVELVEATDDSAVDLTSAITSDLIPYMSNARTFYTISTDNLSSLNVEPIMQTYPFVATEAYGGTAVDPDTKSADESENLYLGFYSINKTRNNSKLMVYGNGDFVNNENIKQEYTVVPYYVFLTSVSWMFDNDMNMSIPAKENSQDYITITSEAEGNTLIAIFAAIPIVIAGIGLLVWARRRSA